jgi:hypothetical protein
MSLQSSVHVLDSRERYFPLEVSGAQKTRLEGALYAETIPPYAVFLLLARVPAGWNHPAEKDSRQINMLEHVLVAKPLRTLAGHALEYMG